MHTKMNTMLSSTRSPFINTDCASPIFSKVLLLSNFSPKIQVMRIFEVRRTTPCRDGVFRSALKVVFFIFSVFSLPELFTSNTALPRRLPWLPLIRALGRTCPSKLQESFKEYEKQLTECSFNYLRVVLR